MKTKLISIISILLIFIVGISGYFMYQKAEKEKTITKEIHNISKIENTFSETEDRTEKLSILKSTIEEMTDYDRSKKPFEKVSDKYASSISNMQKYFIKEWRSNLCERILEVPQKRRQSFFLREKAFAYWRETFEVTTEKLILLH